MPLTAALLMCTWCVGGCSAHQKRQWKYQSPSDNYRLALEADDADQRRDAVARIGEGGYATSADAFCVLDAVARTDPVTQIRCVAIRTLGRYDDDRPVGTLLTVLQARQPSDEASPADEDVRWEAARALASLENKGVLRDQQRDLACDLFVHLLKGGFSRNVRIIAAEVLGRFQDPKVFEPLIEALGNKDFAIADRAERSLIALTGVTHNYDADAWTQWLAQTQDPFAGAGQTPPTTQPAGPGWWDQQKRMWGRALKMSND